MANRENCIEWLTGQDRVSVSLTQKKYINRVKTLARTHVNEVDYVENADGSIFAHLPLKSLHLYLKAGVYPQLDEEENDETEE